MVVLECDLGVQHIVHLSFLCLSHRTGLECLMLCASGDFFSTSDLERYCWCFRLDHLFKGIAIWPSRNWLKASRNHCQHQYCYSSWNLWWQDLMVWRHYLLYKSHHCSWIMQIWQKMGDLHCVHVGKYCWYHKQRCPQILRAFVCLPFFAYNIWGKKRFQDWQVLQLRQKQSKVEQKAWFHFQFKDCRSLLGVNGDCSYNLDDNRLMSFILNKSVLNPLSQL